MEFKIVVLRREHGDCRFDSPCVNYTPEIAEWLDARLVWVLNRARRLAPAAPELVFLVTHAGLTKTVVVQDRGYEIQMELTA